MIDAPARERDRVGMQVIAAGASPVARAHRVAVIRGTVAALLLLVSGTVVGWLALATPFIGRFMPGVRPTPTETAVAVLAWAFAFITPTSFLILGVARGVGAIEHALALRPTHQAARLARSLGPDHFAVTGLRLPDGRRIAELVLGPFGLAVLGELPPAHLSREVGGRWEVRDVRGRWSPIESPLDRAARDAERVKRWLGSDDRDFVVKVYAAVVTDTRSFQRTPSCAVIAPDDIVPWLSGLPPQRGLTAQRRDQLVADIEAAASSR